jgi:trk system potassium uptake protein
MDLSTKKQEMFIIAGCSDVGSSIALDLSKQGKSVMVIDICADSFNKLGGNSRIMQIEADATDIDVLNRCEAAKAEAFLAVTDNDNANIMIAEIARNIFKIPRVMVKIFDVRNKGSLLADYKITQIDPHLLAIKEFERILGDERSV